MLNTLFTIEFLDIRKYGSIFCIEYVGTKRAWQTKIQKSKESQTMVKITNFVYMPTKDVAFYVYWNTQYTNHISLHYKVYAESPRGCLAWLLGLIRFKENLDR